LHQKFEVQAENYSSLVHARVYILLMFIESIRVYILGMSLECMKPTVAMFVSLEHVNPIQECSLSVYLLQLLAADFISSHNSCKSVAFHISRSEGED
jgi:hypothetical protein